MPKISIIVPVYNVENLLKYCVNSLLNQTYKDFEILLIDDGSKDSSPTLCDEYASSNPVIKVFHKPNGGLSDARNYGIEKAKGDFFLFIDSDDILHRDFCKTLIELQQKYDSDITSTDIVTFFDIKTTEKWDTAEYNENEIILSHNEALHEYFNPSGKRIVYHGLCMKMYKKDLFTELRFAKGRLHEDLYITYQLLDKCNKFVFIPLPFYYYYKKNTNSITSNYREKNLNDEFDALQNMFNFFKDRPDVLKDLTIFAIRHYCYLLFRTQTLPKTQNVIEKKKYIKKWLSENWKYGKCIPLMEKIKMLSKAYLVHFYSLLSKIKNR